MAARSSEILHDLSPLLRVYRDGRVERLVGNENNVPASVDPVTGVQSEDVEIGKNVSARIYLPKNQNPNEKLPLLVYFHGGGFVIESAFSPLYHQNLNLLVAEARVLAVSVNYRLAPENPLPIGYQDSWLALKWVDENTDTSQWLKDYADFNRVYIGGDSAGGNIAHNMAIKAGLEKLENININGMFLNCPYFNGKELIGNEIDNLDEKVLHDKVWLFAYPNNPRGLDDPLINPAMNPNLSSLGCKRVLIYVAGKDGLRDRGLYYKECLCKSGWVGDVEVVEVEGEVHVFNLFNPTSDKAVSMVKRLAKFLNDGH